MRLLLLLLLAVSTPAVAEIIEARDERMLQPGETLSVTARCPGDLMITGGGYVLESFQVGKVMVTANLPAPKQSWIAAVLATQPAADGALHVRLSVTAVCLKP